ncbi:putative multimeric flavodoxin WrbA [Monocercomonoides exilis]|uniref:putative multimeric flavodoxin WrbA n=1 Tax=Monocercomonoides exilis TaxID=2049356 RepID=UPI0035599215|nr:putative multimeric flavodoxin WrbA [Monocercomonoides exilis]
MSSGHSYKVIAFNGSPNPEGSTTAMIEMLFNDLKKENVQCEMIMVGTASCVRGCDGCNKCSGTGHCARAKEGDPIDSWYAKMKEADVIVLASPTHCAGVSTEMKSLIDRCGWMSSVDGDPLKNKIGIALVTAMGSGTMGAFNQIHQFFAVNGIHIVSSASWCEAFGSSASAIKKDEDWASTSKTLVENMMFLLQKLHA